MNKSQVRRLAGDFANGKISGEAYRKRRRTLLDGITAGDVLIESEPSPDPHAMRDTAGLDAEEKPRRVQPALYAVLGVAVLFLLFAVGYALIQSATEPPPPPARSVVQVLPRVESPARIIVESFVTLRDWSAAGIAEFKLQWNELSETQREEARDAIWFKRLTKALHDELKTQKALLEFDQSGRAQKTGARIVALAEFIGIADQLPAFARQPGAGAAGSSAVRPPTPLPPSDAAPPSSALQPEAQTTTERPSPISASREAAATPALPSPGMTWLAGLPADAYTLQLFAVNGLENVAQIRRAHGKLDLKILDYPHLEPRYRVVYGEYGEEAEAKAAYQLLPGALKQAQPVAYVKSVRELRKLGENGQLHGRAPASDSDAGYTLQVFASSNKDNVDRLVNSHPALKLVVKDTSSDSARYRVVYGQFASVALAQAAAAKLPPDVLAQTGPPLVKSVADLEALTRN